VAERATSRAIHTISGSSPLTQVSKSVTSSEPLRKNPLSEKRYYWHRSPHPRKRRCGAVALDIRWKHCPNTMRSFAPCGVSFVKQAFLSKPPSRVRLESSGISMCCESLQSSSLLEAFITRSGNVRSCVWKQVLQEEADAAYDTDGTVLAPRKSKYTFNATPQEYPNGDE
jgi:hypothetical protein